MPIKPLNTSILLALGIAACPRGRKVETGPCLDIPPPEEGDSGEAPTEDTGDVGPCLKMIAPEETGEPDVGPCLEYAIPDPPKEEPEEGSEPQGSLRPGRDGAARARAARGVLERGVLPEDVATILRNRQEERS